MPIKGTYKSTLRYVGAKGGTVTTDVEIIAAVKFKKLYKTGAGSESISLQPESVTVKCDVQDSNTVLTFKTSTQSLEFNIDTTYPNIYHVQYRNRKWRYLDYDSVMKVVLSECGCSAEDRERIVTQLSDKMNSTNLTGHDVLRNKYNILTNAINFSFYGTSEQIGMYSAEQPKTNVSTVIIDGQFYTAVAQAVDDNRNEPFVFTNSTYHDESRIFEFTPGTQYTIKVQNADNSIYVFINGVPLYSYEDDMFKADVIFNDGDIVEIRQKSPYVLLLKDTQSYVLKHRDTYTLYLYKGDVTDVINTSSMAMFEMNNIYVGIACSSFSWNFTHYILTVSPEDLYIIKARFTNKYAQRRPDISQQRFNKECRFECRTIKYLPTYIPETTRDIIQETQGDGFVSNYLMNVTAPVHTFTDSLRFYRALNKSLKLTREKADYFDVPHKIHLHGFGNGPCGWIYSTDGTEYLFKCCRANETDIIVLFSDCSEYINMPPEYLFT